MSTEVATRDTTPAGLVRSYEQEFRTLLPDHRDAGRFVGQTIAALRKDPKLMEAANSDPGSLVFALRDAARLGLEPGTEEYWLTPRKVRGRPTVLGITGYQGYIELMYRTGVIARVVTKVVYADDVFEYVPGEHDRPVHRINWDSDDRGSLRLVYAYAVFTNGHTSDVVVLNRAAINKIKASSHGANSEYSPWNTHEPSMWMKSAVRQLKKIVPTSANFLTERLRAVQEASIPAGSTPSAPSAQPPEGFGAPAGMEHVDLDTGEVVDAEVVEEAAS